MVEPILIDKSNKIKGFGKTSVLSLPFIGQSAKVVWEMGDGDVSFLNLAVGVGSALLATRSLGPGVASESELGDCKSRLSDKGE